MKSTGLVSIVLIGFLTLPKVARAWDNHSALTAAVIRDFADIQKATPVQAERLESFIRAEKAGLARLLENQEAWSKSYVPTYPSRPENLRFSDASGTDAELKDRFLKALRINPTSKTALYKHKIPGVPSDGTPLDATRVTLLPNAFKDATPFVAVLAGQEVLVADVVASAADEPDYGLDIGLWEDNGTEFGKIYGFGEQPFGNPKLEFGTQAPFHMGFYHESGIVYQAAGFLKRTYPEHRIYQFLNLARFAFETGHPYWGWRFAGWGLHYVQDLTQPYHAQVLPGVGVPKVLMINILDLVGLHTPKNNRVQLVSNRHLALENFGVKWISQLLEQNTTPSPFLNQLADFSADKSYSDFSLPSVRNQISLQSVSHSTLVDRTLRKNLPSLLVSDPKYIFGVTDPKIDVLALLQEAGNELELQKMQSMLQEIMKQVGPWSRQFLRAAQSK